jgi:hypothetical protein
MTVEGGRRINPIVYPQNSSADYWLRRAAMTRNKAARIQDPKLQQRLRRVALEYERLATYPSGN